MLEMLFPLLLERLCTAVPRILLQAPLNTFSHIKHTLVLQLLVPEISFPLVFGGENTELCYGRLAVSQVFIIPCVVKVFKRSVHSFDIQVHRLGT